MPKQFEDEDDKVIVIATSDCEKALFIISKDAMRYDTLELRYRDKYAPTVEYLLRTLRKAFGWMEVDRGEKEVENTKCIFSHFGICKNEGKYNNASNKKKMNLKCTIHVMLNCNLYSQKFKNKLSVNYVIIEKAGQIRNL